MKPYVARIAQDLGPFLLLTTEDTLSLVLSTMSVVLDVDKASWLTIDLANSLVLATLEVWTKNNKGIQSNNEGENLTSDDIIARPNIPFDFHRYPRLTREIVRSGRVRDRRKTILANSLHFDYDSEARGVLDCRLSN